MVENELSHRDDLLQKYGLEIREPRGLWERMGQSLRINDLANSGVLEAINTRRKTLGVVYGAALDCAKTTFQEEWIGPSASGVMHHGNLQSKNLPVYTAVDTIFSDTLQRRFVSANQNLNQLHGDLLTAVKEGKLYRTQQEKTRDIA